MIPVSKPQPSAAEFVKWHEDALAAIAAIKKKYKLGMSVEVDDTLYKRAMQFLMPLFNKKCAYCESVITNTHPGDVEHYRPKGRLKDIDGKIVKITVNGKEFDHPGYWWLCYDWSNLLPSCIDCNRPRRQTLSTGQVLTSGKANQFPISAEQKRARAPGAEKNESRLLLHPAFDRPERHLTFDREEGMVMPTVTSAGPSRKAVKSIEVYGLLRDRLVRRRKKAQKAIRRELTIARGLAKRLDEAGPDAELDALLEETLTGLREAMDPSAEYSLMARQMIEPELAQLTG